MRINNLYQVVYDSATIGKNVKFGAFVDIGHNVEIGAGTTISSFCFIPEGVLIGENCFIGPRTTFTNDKYPPSPRSEWRFTVIGNNVSTGAACTILPGITIGDNVTIGAGSVGKRTDSCRIGR
jgi:acetyltransferase-like isoleucine patch superfamily enzyme